MGLPWKNTKHNPISRIVSDLQPPSLLLQTGFPTSVVDLFVRNRHRIRRRSFKKTNHEHCPLHAPPPSPFLTPHSSPAAPHSLHALQQDSMPAHVEFNVLCARPNANANADADAAHSISTSSLFVAAAKMFLVVIPVLSTKNLVLGITLSAFVLFLLYFFGKFAAPFVNPSSIRNRFFRRRDGLIVHGGEEEDPPVNSACSKDIQIVESNSENEQSGLQHERFRNWEKGLGCRLDLEVEVENEEEQGQFQVGRNQRSRSAKLRAKIINTLIPKKLLSGKRLKRNKSDKNKTKQETSNMIMGNEQGTERSCEKEDEEVWQMWKPEEEEEERNKSLDYEFVILMILLGLCGGRFLALVLTVSGCFMLKLIKILNQKRKFG